MAGVLGPSPVASPPLSEVKITSVLCGKFQLVELAGDAAHVVVHVLDHRGIDWIAFAEPVGFMFL